jgi:Raf kinase inhibitor-like YbhB/YbcL family protein
MLAVVLAAALLCGCMAGEDLGDVADAALPGPATDDGGPFTVSSPAIVFEVLDAAYGNRGAVDEAGQPRAAITSPPLVFTNAPAGTVCYALRMQDTDSISVVGYVCDHWLAANIEESALDENASLAAARQMVQGVNHENTVGYIGPAPPQGTAHTYVITVWALDEKLPLDEGFALAELQEAMEGHVLGVAELTASYSNY